MTDKGDPFKDLTFSGAPSEYRSQVIPKENPPADYRAGGEVHSPRWPPDTVEVDGRSVEGDGASADFSELRTEKGWLRVLTALDQHYRFLPETELNERVDEFLFHVKRRAGEDLLCQGLRRP